MTPETEIRTFVTDWVALKVRNVNGLSNISGEVDRLAACMTGEARTLGISGSDLHRIVGDIDDYLNEQYRRVASQPGG